MIFVLSLHRSGTQSIHKFLNAAGFRSIHNPSGRSHLDFQHEWKGREADLDFIFDNIIEHLNNEYDAVSDNPMGVLYEQAYKKFPDSKFVLSTRDPNKWVRSVRKHIVDRDLVPAEKVQYWNFLDWQPLKISELTDHDLCKLYELHKKECVGFFKEKNVPERLCVVNLEEEDVISGKKLSNFLGVSTQPLPWVDEK